ncbi:LacI family DNA-binding transcriptional regulator [Novosphingobium pokkalii]|uniref:LacI family DNA-binding transcriptional regulator n=1 Tax=Novosphingobium pokkalii TaxID=1770194 RepID=A0ABV7V4U7_9SPHN|nr:LacI family DNA-binding transcriptional regulator [Novosphingobium pokkalii]
MTADKGDDHSQRVSPSAILDVALDAHRSVVTIHDVARHAGVSSMTVSRVINGKRHVSEDTRERVNAAIAALNYSPNLTARSFSSAIRIGALYSNPASSNLGTFLMGAFRESGVSGCQFQIEPGVSEQEAIAGFDDAAIAATIWPELTTLRQPIAVMAARAVTLLNEQIRTARSGAPPKVSHLREMLTLVQRASTGPAPFPPS